jgi:hypothetical protein
MAKVFFIADCDMDCLENYVLNQLKDKIPLEEN